MIVEHVIVMKDRLFGHYINIFCSMRGWHLLHSKVQFMTKCAQMFYGGGAWEAALRCQTYGSHESIRYVASVVITMSCLHGAVRCSHFIVTSIVLRATLRLLTTNGS